MSQTTRWYGAKAYFNKQTGTLMKFKPNQAKLLASTLNTTKLYAPFVQILLEKKDWPQREPDTVGGGLDRGWMDGAEWFYGGLGFAARASGGCNCWHSRFTQDYFARSFAPETDHFSVAVLDPNGNLVLRVGKYGNVEDGKPLNLEGGPAQPRALGGDEVGLICPLYLASHTDRRLFIADIGNERIVSVKLGYHAEERIALPAVPATNLGLPKEK